MDRRVTRSFTLPESLLIALGRRAARQRRSTVGELEVLLTGALAAELAEVEQAPSQGAER